MQFPSYNLHNIALEGDRLLLVRVYVRTAHRALHGGWFLFCAEMLCRGLALVVDDGHLRGNLPQGVYDLLEYMSNLVAVCRVSALGADKRRNIFDNDDVLADLDHERSLFLLERTFAHKAAHCTFSFRVFPSDAQRSGSG